MDQLENTASESLAETALEKPEGMSQAEWENKLLREENKRLKAERDAYRKTLPPKERLYDHIQVSVKTMDRIIAVLVLLFVVVIVLGILNR